MRSAATGARQTGLTSPRSMAILKSCSGCMRTETRCAIRTFIASVLHRTAQTQWPSRRRTAYRDPQMAARNPGHRLHCGSSCARSKRWPPRGAQMAARGYRVVGVDSGGDGCGELGGCAQVAVFKWLHENCSEGCTSNALVVAASRGSFDKMLLLRAHYLSVRCTTEAVFNAVEYEHIDMFWWLRANSTSWSKLGAWECSDMSRLNTYRPFHR